MPNRIRRRARTVVVLGAVLSAALVVPGFAAARPHTAPHSAPRATPRVEPSIADVQKQLGQLALKNSQVVEHFNQARIAVVRSQQAADAASAAARAANTRYRAAQVAFTRIVQAQYETGGMNEAGALFDSESGNNYLDRLNTLDLISAHTADVVRSVAAEKRLASAAAKKATTALAKAKAQKAALAADKTSVQKQISKYELLLATLTLKQQQRFARSYNPSVSAKVIVALQNNIAGIGSPAARRAVQFALKQVGKPYVWGAAGPGSYDCSGLTMASWHQAGVSLPHSAANQFNYGSHVPLDQLRPGDLIFMYHPIGHVTIYAGNGMMVSAPTEGQPVTVVSVQSFARDIVGAVHLK